MDFKDFWYVVAESRELKPGKVLARKVLGEWLAVFRDAEGNPVALQDRCKHRSVRLSGGTLCGGQLRCPYHGWTYDAKGEVIAVPSEDTRIRVCGVRETRVRVRLRKKSRSKQQVTIQDKSLQ